MGIEAEMLERQNGLLVPRSGDTPVDIKPGTEQSINHFEGVEVRVSCNENNTEGTILVMGDQSMIVVRLDEYGKNIGPANHTHLEIDGEKTLKVEVINIAKSQEIIIGLKNDPSKSAIFYHYDSFGK